MDSLQSRLEAAAEFGDVSDELLARLEHPRRTIETRLTAETEDGATVHVLGWRVQHDDARGPFKGGLRYHPGVDRHELERLAFGMTLKCALHRLPLGGAKGGLALDPSRFSRDELRRLTRRFARELAPFIGPADDVPAPDVNTGPEIMRWFREGYSQTRGRDHAALVTGKSVDDGGIPGRDEATGTGAFFAIRELLDELDDRSPPDTTFAIQGLGSAARPLARGLSDAGFRVVAVSDSSGGVSANGGLDVEAVIAGKESEGSLEAVDLASVASGEAERISNEDLLTLDVDVLVPAALGNVIHEANAHEVQADYVFEVANLPVTPVADDVLADRGVHVFPDILVNGGGVTVSRMEWRSNIDGTTMERDEVIDELETVLCDSVGRTIDRVRACGGQIRTCTILEALAGL